MIMSPQSKYWGRRVPPVPQGSTPLHFSHTTLGIPSLSLVLSLQQDQIMQPPIANRNRFNSAMRDKFTESIVLPGLHAWQLLVRVLCNYAVSQKNIPDIINCNFKNGQLILIIFGRNIPDTASHSTIVQVSTSPNVCSCTTCGNRNKQNITFLSKVV